MPLRNDTTPSPGINLVVDDDTAKSTHLSIPVGDHVANVPFDRWQSQVPFEERHVLDEEVAEVVPAAGRRVHFAPGRSGRGWPWDVWRSPAGRTTKLLGERIVRGRARSNARWDFGRLRCRWCRRCAGRRRSRSSLRWCCARSPTSTASTTTPSSLTVGVTASRARIIRCRPWCASRVGTRPRFGLALRRTKGRQAARPWSASPPAWATQLWAETDRLRRISASTESWAEQWLAFEKSRHPRSASRGP